MLGAMRCWLAEANRPAGLWMVMHSISKGMLGEFPFRK